MIRPSFSGAAASFLAMGVRLSCFSSSYGNGSLSQTRGASGGAGGGGLARLDRLRVEPAGAVGGADQRAGHHAGEADLVGLVLQLHELLRLHPALHGVVAGGGAEV